MIVIDGLTPKRQYEPSSIEELSETLARAYRSEEAVAPIGSGTKLQWGNVPNRLDCLISLSALDRVLEHEPADLTVSVQAGCKLSSLQAKLREQGQFLPIDPPYGDKATIGGIVACGSSGPLRFRYGPVRDMIIGIKVVHADGTITKAGGKVVKNVTGYDLCKLYTGSYGTLAVIAEVNFKLQPLPEVEKTCVISFPDLQSALASLKQILSSQLMPTALELLNRRACQALNRVVSGFPISSYALAIRFSDVLPAVKWQVDELGSKIKLESLNVFEDQDHALIWETISNYPEDVKSRVPELLTVKSSTLFDSIAETIRLTEEIARSLGSEVEIVCHAGNSIVYGYIGCEVDSDDKIASFKAALENLRAYITDGGGSAVIQEAPLPLKRSVDVWGYNRSELKLMRALKAKFDPKNILNPGRFVARI